MFLSMFFFLFPFMSAGEGTPDQGPLLFEDHFKKLSYERSGVESLIFQVYFCLALSVILKELLLFYSFIFIFILKRCFTVDKLSNVLSYFRICIGVFG